MPVALEGGCFVTALREGEPDQHPGIRIWRHVHRGTGATAISLRVLEFAPGTSPAIRTPRCDEILYVLEGEATLIVDGATHRIGRDVGVYLGPGTFLTVENPGPAPLTVVSSQCPIRVPLWTSHAACPAGRADRARVQRLWSHSMILSER